MKQMIISKFRSFSALLAACFFHTISFAQDSSTKVITQNKKVTTETTTVNYGEPWMWVIGGIVVVVLLVLMFRGKSGNTSSDKVTVTKTVERE